MCEIEIIFGHSAWQAPVLVQLPKPSSSILATIALRGGHPRHVPAAVSRATTHGRRRKASPSRSYRSQRRHRNRCRQRHPSQRRHRPRDGNVVGILHGIRTDRDEAAGLKNLIVGTAIHHEVLDYGESRRTPGLDDDRRPVFETAHVNLAGRGAVARAVRTASMCSEHIPQIPSRQSWSNATGSLPRGSGVVQNIQHLEKRGVGGDVLDFVGFECPFCLGVFSGAISLT